MENYNPSKSSPEYSFYHKVMAFFDGDPDIDVCPIDEFKYEFTILVHNEKKCEILKKILFIPPQARRLKVNIVYGDDIVTPTVSEADLAYLLENNKYFSQYVDSDRNGKNGFAPELMKYILMKPVTVQYYDDIFNNPYGQDTKTAEQLAKELFHGCRCNITSDIDDENIGSIR